MREFKDYVRVTDVLYPLTGLNKVDPNILKNAADRGTKVHEICDALLNDLGIYELDNKLQGYIESFATWYPSKKFIDKPARFYCDKYMITGECDAIYEGEEGLVLVDIKTPVNESKTWKVQGSAYSYLAKINGYDIKKIEFVKLSKEGKPPTIYQYEEDFPLFLKCLDIYNHFHKNFKDDTGIDYL